MKKENWSMAAKSILCSVFVLMLLLSLCLTVPAQASEGESAVQTVDVGIPVEERPELFLTRSMPTHGEGKIAVFLIDFPDYPNDNPLATREYYDKLYFSGGVETTWGQTTVADFYRGQSYGKLNISGQVFDWYTAKHERSYYDIRKNELVAETMEYYRLQGVDFSQFDGDSDGVVDSLVYHFAGGETTGEQDDPWYHGVRYSMGGIPMVALGDLKVTTIVQVFENARVGNDLLGIVCHELMHNFGMSDLYSEYQLSYDHALIDLMSGTKKFINPYTKMLLGWVDTVTIVTGDIQNLRLDPYNEKEMGDVVIVTDEWNGLFDEYFLVAYKGEFDQHDATAWHIDARLNESGTAFLYENQYYLPDPDKGHAHGITNLSEQLFIEELSANPNYNFVMKPPGGTGNTSFGVDSALGPNGTPSSDMHDGSYTGITIDNFVEHNEEYLTLDISFVSDTAKPIVATDESDLEMKETIAIWFNEYVYKAEAWDNIQVTDLNGNPLDVSVGSLRYPRFEMEFTFRTEDYKNGYKIILPENCVKDSSGNGIDAVTLTASLRNYFFPSDEVLLPNVGEFVRHNDDAFMFLRKDGFVVITNLWENLPEGNQPYRKIELMTLDWAGNVLSQIIVDNPIDDCILTHVIETGDGGYVLFCRDESVQWGGGDILFGIDAYGKLKWVNMDYHNSGVEFLAGNHKYYLPREDGVVMGMMNENAEQSNLRYRLIFIDSNTGVIRYPENTPFDNGYWVHDIFALSQNELLLYRSARAAGYMEIAIVDAEDFSIVREKSIPFNAAGRLTNAYLNSDGSMFLVVRTDEGDNILLLDAGLELVKCISWETTNVFGDEVYWFDNDGFCYVDKTLMLSHKNSEYTVYRYDRNLNLMWTSALGANFVFYYQDDEGGIRAYRSMWEPERECYIDTYGPEDAFRTEHIHNLTHVEGVEGDCNRAGVQEHWHCDDCGAYFWDEGHTPVVDVFQLSLPAHKLVDIPAVAPTCNRPGNSAGSHCTRCGKNIDEPYTLPPTEEHMEEIIPAVAPTCGMPGSTEGVRCSVCETILKKQEKVPATGEHTEEIIPAVEPTCGKAGATQGIECSKCDAVVVKSEVIPATGKHTEIIIPAIAPTCNQSGATEGIRCPDCASFVVKPEVIPATGEHQFGEWTVYQAATCQEEGRERRECGCGKKESRVTSIGDHSFGEWTVIAEATTEMEGEETRTCDVCGETETRSVSKLPPEDPVADEPDAKGNLVVIIAAVAAVGVGGAVAAVFLLKKKK